MTDERTKQVRELAYAIWEKSGRPSGKSDAHWAKAEKQLNAKTPTKAKPKTSAVPTVKAKKPAAESVAAPSKKASAETPNAPVKRTKKTFTA